MYEGILGFLELDTLSGANIEKVTLRGCEE